MWDMTLALRDATLVIGGILVAIVCGYFFMSTHAGYAVVGWLFDR